MHMAGWFGRALNSVHVRLAWEGRSRKKYTDLKRLGERERARERIKTRVKKRKRGRQKRVEEVKS